MKLSLTNEVPRDYSAARWIALITKLQTAVNANIGDLVFVSQYGAVGDGVTDDTSAIQAAIDDGLVILPPNKTYLITSPLIADDSSILIFGWGTLKAGAAISSLLHVGPTSGTGSVTGVNVLGIRLDGNNLVTGACLKARNSQYGIFRELIVNGNGCSGIGVQTDTSTASINTQTVRNEFEMIRATNCGEGFKFQGEKDSRFNNLFAHDNDGDGFEFKAFINDDDDLAETTQCALGMLMSRDNGGNGFTMDMIEKFVAANLISTGNSGYGMEFRTSYTTATDNGSNSMECANYFSRNDLSGGIVIADDAYVYGLNFATCTLYGFNCDTDAPGLHLKGVSATGFGKLLIQGYHGTAAIIEEGTPFGGGTVQSNGVTFGTLHILGNGDSGASGNHGLSILDSSTDFKIEELHLSNTETDGPGYELNADSTVTNIVIDSVSVNPATTGAGFNINGAGIHMNKVKIEGQTPMMCAYDGVTAPTLLPSTNHALIYVDTSDGDLKVKFGDGFVGVIVADS